MSGNDQLRKNADMAATFISELSKVAARAPYLGLYKVEEKLREALGIATQEMADELRRLDKEVCAYKAHENAKVPHAISRVQP